MTTLPTGPPRSRWPRVAGAIGILIALVVAAVIVTNTVMSRQKPTPTATATSPSTAPTAVMPAPGANGCLGGVDPNKAVLIAQQEAPLTAKGAAEFIATVMRWGAQYPVDPNYSRTAGLVFDAAGPLATFTPSPNAGPEDASWSTTLDGRYLVREMSNSGATVDVVLGGYSRINGVQSNLDFSGRVQLSVIGGHWRQLSAARLDDTDKAKVETTGSTYVGGC